MTPPLCNCGKCRTDPNPLHEATELAKRDLSILLRENGPALEGPGIICPFCDEGDFDRIGLKLHLTRGHCAAFEGTPAR